MPKCLFVPNGPTVLWLGRARWRASPVADEGGQRRSWGGSDSASRAVAVGQRLCWSNRSARAAPGQAAAYRGTEGNGYGASNSSRMRQQRGCCGGEGCVVAVPRQPLLRGFQPPKKLNPCYGNESTTRSDQARRGA
ncbi:hypothetical protein AAHA92_22042 [Salvia divinorum]|uniref:Uncharacterized protein n=1 Tax=Salvia divinorum TaxID=28513 RepID=A0ABD1GMD7_SALDI